MHFTETSNQKELPLLNQQMDAFVCGSDVIWNTDLNNRLGAFYLDFATKYRFSYAASFGKSEIGKQEVERIKEYFVKFNSISVREKTSKELLKRCGIDKASIVCDPVFLLEQKEWNSLIPINENNNKNKNKKYIFVYITHLSEAVQKFLDDLKMKTGLRIVYSAYGPKQAIKLGMIQVQKPQEWLRLIRDAEFVVTNSFHATAFSVLFHKKFYTVVNGEKTKGINVRMNDFLSGIGLSDRIFSIIPDELDLSEIDYSDVDEKIQSIREDSLEFLRENIEAAYRQKMELD